MQKSFLLLLQLIVPLSLTTGTYTAVRNGNWNAASTWSLGSAPSNNSTIIIPSAYTVTVNFNSPTYTSVDVPVDGTLSFNKW